MAASTSARCRQALLVALVFLWGAGLSQASPGGCLGGDGQFTTDRFRCLSAMSPERILRMIHAYDDDVEVTPPKVYETWQQGNGGSENTVLTRPRVYPKEVQQDMLTIEKRDKTPIVPCKMRGIHNTTHPHPDCPETRKTGDEGAQAGRGHPAELDETFKSPPQPATAHPANADAPSSEDLTEPMLTVEKMTKTRPVPCNMRGLHNTTGTHPSCPESELEEENATKGNTQAQAHAHAPDVAEMEELRSRPSYLRLRGDDITSQAGRNVLDTPNALFRRYLPDKVSSKTYLPKAGGYFERGDLVDPVPPPVCTVMDKNFRDMEYVLSRYNSAVGRHILFFVYAPWDSASALLAKRFNEWSNSRLCLQFFFVRINLEANPQVADFIDPALVYPDIMLMWQTVPGAEESDAHNRTFEHLEDRWKHGAFQIGSSVTGFLKREFNTDSNSLWCNGGELYNPTPVQQLDCWLSQLKNRKTKKAASLDYDGWVMPDVHRAQQTVEDYEHYAEAMRKKNLQRAPIKETVQAEEDSVRGLVKKSDSAEESGE